MKTMWKSSIAALGSIKENVVGTVQQINSEKKFNRMVDERLIEEVLKDDVAFIQWIDAMVEQEILYVNMQNYSLILLKRNNKFEEYTSPRTKAYIEDSIVSYQDRVTYYNEEKKKLEEKKKGDHDSTTLQLLEEDIETKAKPMEFDKWIKSLVVKIIVADLSSRDFLKLYFKQAKGLETYLNEKYPN